MIFASSLIGAAPGRGACPIQRPLTFDLIYTDYHGLAHLHGAMGLAFVHYQYDNNFGFNFSFKYIIHPLSHFDVTLTVLELNDE